MKKVTGDFKIIFWFILLFNTSCIAYSQGYETYRANFFNYYTHDDTGLAINNGELALKYAETNNLLFLKSNYQIAGGIAQFELGLKDTLSFIKYQDLAMRIASRVGRIYDMDLASFYWSSGYYYLAANRIDRALIAFDLGKTYSLMFIPDSVEYNKCLNGESIAFNKIYNSDHILLETENEYRNLPSKGFNSKKRALADKIYEGYKRNNILIQPQSIYYFPIIAMDALDVGDTIQCLKYATNSIGILKNLAQFYDKNGDIWVILNGTGSIFRGLNDDTAINIFQFVMSQLKERKLEEYKEYKEAAHSLASIYFDTKLLNQKIDTNGIGKIQRALQYSIIAEGENSAFTYEIQTWLAKLYEQSGMIDSAKEICFQQIKRYESDSVYIIYGQYIDSALIKSGLLSDFKLAISILTDVFLKENKYDNSYPYIVKYIEFV